MTNNTPSIREKLLTRLEQSDASRREERVDRIIWMSNHNDRPSVFGGSAEAIGVFSEAEAAYREGHFISVILLAQAFIEHDLVTELIHRKVIAKGETLNKVLEEAKKHQILEDQLVDRINQLRLIRNPFVHPKKPNDPNNLSSRYQSQKVHPRDVLEKDAQEAFRVMFDVFRALLREGI